MESFPGGGVTPLVGLEAGLDEKILSFYEDLQAGRVGECETTLLSMVGAYPDSIAFANMLPALLATSVPKILGSGSRHFLFSDGTPLKFETVYTPPEYTMVYLELMIHKPLMGSPALPLNSPVHRTLSVMWDVLLEILPAIRRDEALRRFEAYAPLPDNVIRFRPRTKH